MNTYQTTKDALTNKEPICYGYKAVKWDSGTQQNFCYGEVGEDLTGKLFAVDGDIAECKWGLHFSKAPAHVFNFYEPLGHNRYFKVAAYEKAVDDADGCKTVAQVIEFIEEYDMMQYIEIVKRYDRGSNAVYDSNAVCGSDAVRGSNAVCGSDAVSYSNAVYDSNAVCGSDAVRGSNAVCGSDAVSYSNAVYDSNAVCGSDAVRGSNAVCGSYGLRECFGMYGCVFCHGLKGKAFYLFNHKSTEARTEEVLNRLRSFNWVPHFASWYDIKGNKEWWAFCFPQLENVDNDIAWSKMPAEMLEYIKSLPEFDEKVWQKITGR